MPDIIRPMPPRDSGEAHRAATPLELLFDLVSVIAIASAAAGLHHAIAEAHTLTGTISYLMAFFAIWWAWMNYTWFASAYDNDDTLFRLLTMVIMAGSLAMAAGIGPMFERFDLRLVVIGFVIMRIGMVALWLRAARGDASRRETALTYAGGIAAVQVYWVVFTLLQPLTPALGYAMFAAGAGLELAVPVAAERRSVTPWHRHHIIERYGLLNIIVLGETLLAGSFALAGAAEAGYGIVYVDIALSALVIVFALWWLYFAREDHLRTRDLAQALRWGYGHFAIFASGAGVGAGFAVLVDIAAHKAHVPPVAGHYAVAIPVAVYLAGLWFVRDRFCFTGPAAWVLPVFAAAILATPFAPFALESIAALTVLAAVARNLLARR